MTICNTEYKAAKSFTLTLCAVITVNVSVDDAKLHLVLSPRLSFFSSRTILSIRFNSFSFRAVALIYATFKYCLRQLVFSQYLVSSKTKIKAVMMCALRIE